MASMMRAVLKANPAPGLTMVDDYPIPQISAGQVLVKVRAASICGTDLHIYNWDEWARKTIKVPTTIGHEFVGEIVDVGSNVVDFHSGDIVSVEGHLVCGRCRNCR